MGTTIAGISVLSGVPCDEEEDVDVGGAARAAVGDELIVGFVDVEMDDVAVAMASDLAKVSVSTSAEMVQVLIGCPSELV